MSLGYIGYCKKIDEDSDAVMYAYSGVNLNDPNSDLDAEKAYDGELFILKKSILELPRTKHKQLTEYIDWTSDAIESGVAIVLQPCKNAFIRSPYNPSGIDYIAYRCLHKIFKRFYQENTFP